MKIKKTTPLGAEVSDIDLSNVLTESDHNLIKEAFLDNLVLFFKNQKFKPQKLLMEASVWGSPQQHPVFKGLEEHPEIINGVRKNRIAKGSGTDIQEVNKLMKQFNDTKKMMKMMSRII